MSKIKVYPVNLFHDYENELQQANGSLLPLGLLFAYAKKYKDGILNNYFLFQGIEIYKPAEWNIYVEHAKDPEPAIWAFSSYIWNHKYNMSIAQKIKRASPESLIVMGGPHVPAYEEENKKFFCENPFVDITARGQGEITFAEILEVIGSAGRLDADFSSVAGITFRKGDQLVRTPDRPKVKDINIFPSPYLTGELDKQKLDGFPFLVLETNRGCPYGCTFCDWGSATMQKFSLFDTDRVMKEIEYIAQRGVRHIYLADSNFGAFERDVDIAQHIADCKSKYGAPQIFATSYAKNASPRLAKIIKILAKAKLSPIGLVSIQSTDPKTLSAINRSNIKNEKYEKLIEIFRNEKLDLSSELMIGLPGQTLESHKNDLQFFFDRKLMPFVYATAVMPNAPMNDPEYRMKYQIVTNEDGYVVSTSTFTREEREKMEVLSIAFHFFYGAGVLKYFLYYLQVEHGIRAMDFIQSYIDESVIRPDIYPSGNQIVKIFLVSKSEWWPILHWTSKDGELLFNHLDKFYREIIFFIKEKFLITLKESVADTLYNVQIAVMPSIGKELPLIVDLPHDFQAYMEQIKNMNVITDIPVNFKKLEDFSPGTLKVSSARNRKIVDVGMKNFNRFTGRGFELRSALQFNR